MVAVKRNGFHSNLALGLPGVEKNTTRATSRIQLILLEVNFFTLPKNSKDLITLKFGGFCSWHIYILVYLYIIRI